MKNIATITLDFWDTITKYPFTEEIFMERVGHAHDIFQVYGLSYDRTIELMRSIYIHFEEIWINEHRTPTTAEMFKNLEKNSGVKFSEEHFNELVIYNENLVPDKYFKIDTDIIKAIKELSQKYKIILISDTGFEPGKALRKAIAGTGLKDIFKYEVFSDETGYSKPDPRAFKLASDISKTEFSKMLHIGDREEKDIKGAKSLGMYSILYTGFRDSDKDNTTADRIVSSWDEIMELLE
ncbi:MAG: HAD-IA family hydrolase [Candidatus Delongbacteria bacterium]|nr:HAD-IA family hydrolase [Candidatus Delongbacteria bacterium]